MYLQRRKYVLHDTVFPLMTSYASSDDYAQWKQWVVFTCMAIQVEYILFFDSIAARTSILFFFFLFAACL